MQRADHRHGVILGARRRALLEGLRGVRVPIHLCAPAGYGKTTFLQLLHAGTMAAPVHEERTLRMARCDGVLIGAEQLAFDDEELERMFSAVQLPGREFERIRELAGGWPIAVLYFLRLVRLGVLERVLHDLADPAMDDLYEYIEYNVYASATRTQRLALLIGESGFFGHPLVRAAMQAYHEDEIRAARLHRAQAAMRKSEHAVAAHWFLAAGDAESLQRYPQVWLHCCEQRLEQLGAAAFAAEAASIVKAMQPESNPSVYARSSLWLAIAHAMNGNIAAALAARDRAGEFAGDARLTAALAAQPAKALEAPAAALSCGLRIELFRGRALLDDQEIQLAQREAAVLFTLSAAPQRSIDPQRLASVIWPELDAGQSHAALKVAVTRLRSRLGIPGLVRFTNGKYALHDDVRIDLAELTQALQAYERDRDERTIHDFQHLLGSYRPPRLRDAEWFAPIESELVQCSHRLADHLAQPAISRGDVRALQQIGNALLDADACDEEGCALVIRSYMMEGRIDLGRAEYDRFAERLYAELGCEPSFTFESLAATAYA